MLSLGEDEFDRLMGKLGPFGDSPSLAVAVSGGADSLALAILTAGWVRARGGSVTAIVLDHGLRPGAGAEAAATVTALSRLGIGSRSLRLYGLPAAAGVEERARRARHARLEAAAAEIGVPWLLFGHQAADQAETILLRVLSGSGPAGRAAMAARRETARVALLRPLIGVPPGRLRAVLAARGLGWVVDPDNADRRFRRASLRFLRADREGGGVATAALQEAAVAAGRARRRADAERAELLAARVSVYPTGHARLSPGGIAPGALASLLRTLSGALFALSEGRVAALAAKPHPATLGGVRVMPAGRSGPGWLLVREASAMAPAVPAIPGVRWDGRFRLLASARPPAGGSIGALGEASAGLRGRSPLPAAVLATLPALWLGEKLVAVPHLGYPSAAECHALPMAFAPNEPAAGAAFAGTDGDGDAERGV